MWSASNSHLALGAIVAGKYKLEAELGSGGMGAVYRATHLVTGRRVALKWLVADADELTRQRFCREAQALGAIDHPGVVGVIDLGEHEGSPFLVMEYLEGKSLRAYAYGRTFAPAEVVRLLMPVLEGMATVHEAGIVHRDIKPENIFVCLDVDGTAFDAKIVDFGVARTSARDLSLTQSGTTVGTPRYMAPEQFRGDRDVDPRADIFALGLVLYELLAGRLPYDAETYEVLLLEIATRTPASPTTYNPAIPEELGAIVLRALARDRNERFPDVATLARALEPFGENVCFHPPRRAQFRVTSSWGDLALEGTPSIPNIAARDAIPTVVSPVGAHSLPTVVHRSEDHLGTMDIGSARGAPARREAELAKEDSFAALRTSLTGSRLRRRGTLIAFVTGGALLFLLVHFLNVFPTDRPSTTREESAVPGRAPTATASSLDLEAAPSDAANPQVVERTGETSTTVATPQTPSEAPEATSHSTSVASRPARRSATPRRTSSSPLAAHGRAGVLRRDDL